MQEFNKDFDIKMQKTIEVVMSDFASVRAGRANAAVLDKITVDYYGTPHQPGGRHLFPRSPQPDDPALGQLHAEGH